MKSEVRWGDVENFNCVRGEEEGEIEQISLVSLINSSILVKEVRNLSQYIQAM